MSFWFREWPESAQPRRPHRSRRTIDLRPYDYFAVAEAKGTSATDCGPSARHNVGNITPRHEKVLTLADRTEDAACGQGSRQWIKSR